MELEARKIQTRLKRPITAIQHTGTDVTAVRCPSHQAADGTVTTSSDTFCSGLPNFTLLCFRKLTLLATLPVSNLVINIKHTSKHEFRNNFHIGSSLVSVEFSPYFCIPFL